jgi:drug/metabolite transporter (DMT)-like permease
LIKISVQNIVIFGLLFGIISTIFVHLGKVMERQGIEIYSREKSFKEKGNKPMIYLIGVIFNNSVVLWQIIAMQYSTAAVFSSVFGLGLILLMLYSHFVLHEDIKKPEIIGSILIVIGTTVIGIIQLTEPTPIENVNFVNIYILLIVIVLIFPIILIMSIKKKYAIAIVVGIVAGTLSGLDNVFKRIGLKEGIANIINVQTLPLFVISFIMALTAFALCQIAFAKGAEASKLVPIYNSFYIAIPVIVELFIYEGTFLSVEKIFALSLIIVGVFFMQSFKTTEKTEECVILLTEKEEILESQ